MVALQELSAQASWELIKDEQLGRLAFHGPEGLTLVPVNVRVDEEVLWIRTGSHSALAASVEDSAVVALLDRLDPDTHLGWSVQVRGVCELLLDPSSVPAQVRDLMPWVEGPKPVWIKLQAARLTGRVSVAGDPPSSY